MEKSKVELAAPKVIIKNEGIRNVVNSWEVGSKVSTAELAFFSSVLTPEDFYAIPEANNISAWEIVSKPTYGSERLGHINQRGVVRPIPNQNLTSLDINNSIKRNIEAAHQVAGEQAAHQYRMRNLEVLSEMNRIARTAVGDLRQEGRHKNLPVVADYSRFLVDKTGPQPSVTTMSMYEEYLRTGIPVTYAGQNPIDLHMFTNGDSKATESIVSGIQKVKDSVNVQTYPDLINLLVVNNEPEFGRNQKALFTANNVVYGQAAGSEYQQRFGINYVAGTPRGLHGEIYDDIGKESVDTLYTMIHDSANELHYTRRNAMNDLDIEELDVDAKKYGEYQSDVFEKTVESLKKDEPSIYNYFAETSGLLPHEEEQLISERNERAALIGITKAEAEYEAKKSAMIEHNMSEQVKAFFDTYEMQRNDYRASLDGKTSSKAGGGFSQEDINDLYQEKNALNKIEDENEKSYKRLLASSFRLNKEGKYERIEDKTPRRPTDKLVMATGGQLQNDEAVLINDLYRVAQNRTQEQIASEMTEIGTLLDNPNLSPAQKEILERRLTVVNQELDAQRKKIASFKFNDPDSDFETNLTNSYQAMLDSGRANLEAAEAEKKVVAARIREVTKTKVEQVFDLHGISSKSAMGLRSSLVDDSLSLHESLQESINRINGINLNSIGDEFNAAKTDLIDERNRIATSLGLLRDMDTSKFGHYSAKEHLTQGTAIKSTLSGDTLNQYESFVTKLHRASDGLALFKHRITDNIEAENNKRHSSVATELQHLQDRLKGINNVISNKGYDKTTMGNTIIDGEAVHQIGLSKEDYIRYLDKPEELAKDMANLSKHKVLVEKANNAGNVSSWLDAERKGRIIAGDSNDTIGYKVKVSPDQKTAHLVQPAVRTDSLQFLDSGITNAELVAAIKSGNLDYDARPTSHVVDMEPIIDYTDKEYISVISDPVARKLFNKDMWDEEKEGYVKKDIDAIFEGRKVKGFNLTGAMKEQIETLKGEWEATSKAQIESLVPLDNVHEELMLEQKSAQNRMIQMRRDLSNLTNRQEAIKKSLLTASSEDAAILRQQAAKVVEEIDEIHKSSKLVSEHITQLNSQIIEQADVIAKTRAGFTTVDSLKEKAFGIVKGIHKENEESRLARNAQMIEALGIDLDDVNEEATQIKINKDSFSKIFLSDPKETNPRFAFNKRLRDFMGSQFTHKSPEEYGEVSAGILEMYARSQHYGREIDIRQETYARQVLSDISGGEAMSPDELTKKQRADYNARVASYAKMSPIDRLDASLFEDIKSFAIKEMFSDDTIDEPAYAHSIRQIQRRLNDTEGASNVSGESIRREITRMRKTLGQAEKIARGRLESEFDDIPVTKSMVQKQLQKMIEDRDTEIADIASDVSLIRSVPDNIFKLSAAEIDKVVRVSADVGNGISEYSIGLAGDIERLVEDNPYDRELYNYDQEFKQKMTPEYEAAQELLRQNKESYEYFRKQEVLNWMDDAPDKVEFRETVDDMEKFVQLDRNEQISRLLGMVEEGAEKRGKKQFYSNVISNIDSDVKVLPKYLAGDADLTLKILKADDRWTRLLESDNPYYQNVEERMTTLKRKFEIYTGQKHGEESLSLAREFKKLREFAFISMVNPSIAGKMADIETLSAILPEGELMRKGLANPTTNLVEQMMQVAQEGGKSLRAVIQVPGEDFTTEVELRKLEDGTIEAYSEHLKQGFVVNETGQGKHATARTDATSAYSRSNNIAAVKSASASRPVLREPLPTHSLSKRKGEAVNIGNITAGVVDGIQAVKDSSVIMAYDIETTMTGSKKLADVTQPIDIYAEKIQYDPETGELLERDGRTYIKSQEERFVTNPDGSTEYKKVDIEKHSSFTGIVALNEQSTNLLKDLTNDPTRLVVDFGDKSMHVADIADVLEWRKEMTDSEKERFNARKNKFLRENFNLSRKETARVKDEIEMGMEHLRFLSNVSKYGVGVEDRGSTNPLDLPKGTLDLRREKGVFELFSQNKFVPTHDEVMNRLLGEHMSGVHSYQLEEGIAGRLFGVGEDGNPVRLDKGGSYERMVVAGVQSQYTQALLDTANNAAKILADEGLSKEAFGQDILHFTNQEDAIKAFREFAQMDNVASVIGSNTELADNLTLIQSLPDGEEKAKLMEFFNNTGVTDQQVTARYMFPELRSLSNESILTAMGVDISDAHASNVDVRANIQIHSEFVKDVFNIVNGGEAKYQGVKALVDTLGITKDTANIYDQQSYRVGDFVFMKEKYDDAPDKPVTYGQVGVYRIEELDEGFKSMSLSRQIVGKDGMIEDTSIERLSFSAPTNAMFESKVAEKLRFISDVNDENVLSVAKEYQADITRGHFSDIMKSDNKYYIHASQSNAVSSAFNSNPLFSIDNAGSVINNSNSNGMVSLGSTPLENARNLYLGAQAIINKEAVGLTSTPNGRFQFNIGTEIFSLDNKSNIQTININGMDVEALVDTGTQNPVVRINPRGVLDQHSFSETDQNILRGLQEGLGTLNSSDEYYVPAITKEHMQALNEIDTFNQTGLGQQTRMLMDDLVTLKNIGAIDDGTKTNILRNWNESLIEQANQLGARDPVRGMAVLDRIDYLKTSNNAEGAETTAARMLNRTINLNSPKEAVDSIVRIANDIGMGYKGIKGTENRETHIATNFLIDPMIRNGLLPAGFNEGNSGNVSLDHLAVSAVNHTRENGIANPLTRVDYNELADIMDTTNSHGDFAGTFRATYLDNILGNLTLNQRESFNESKKLLQQAVDSNMYVNGMNMTAPIKLNLDDAITLETLNSKSFFNTWTVDDLKTTADSLLGSDQLVHRRLNESIYGELANRAAGGIKSELGIDPEQIRLSGDAERINAAVALNWLQPTNALINGEREYSVMPIEERRLAYTYNAGMKLNDMMLNDISYAATQANVSESFNNASYQQQQMLKQWQNQYHPGYDMTKERKYVYQRVGGVMPPEMLASTNEAIIEQAENHVRPDTTRPEIASEIIEPRSVRDFKTPINITGATGEPLVNATTVEAATTEPLERIIESPTKGRPLSEVETFIGDTKNTIRDKMNTFLNGSSGGKWVAGLGVAAAALYAVNASAGPLKLEDRPQGHGVKGFAGAPEDDNRTQRETKSVQVDTSSTAYVNSGDSGYTIQAKGRAGSNIDTGQLQNAVGGMQGASSVNVNIRDDRSSIDSNWLESQFSNYINRGYAGE